MEPLDYQQRDDAKREIGWRRRLFGPSCDDVWKQLADQIGAGHEPGKWWRPGRVRAGVGPWRLTLDIEWRGRHKNSPYTRLRAPFANPRDFRFLVRRALPFFDDIGKLFGMQDVTVGDAWFDEAFILKSNHETYLRFFLRDRRLRELIAAHPDVVLEVEQNAGDDSFGAPLPAIVDVLEFTAYGEMKDIERLHLLFDMFVAALNRLCVIRTATALPPGVDLAE